MVHGFQRGVGASPEGVSVFKLLSWDMASVMGYHPAVSGVQDPSGGGLGELLGRVGMGPDSGLDLLHLPVVGDGLSGHLGVAHGYLVPGHGQEAGVPRDVVVDGPALVVGPALHTDVGLGVLVDGGEADCAGLGPHHPLTLPRLVLQGVDVVPFGVAASSDVGEPEVVLPFGDVARVPGDQVTPVLRGLLLHLLNLPED